jgi:methyl-accepting chemotaxis protein
MRCRNRTLSPASPAADFAEEVKYKRRRILVEGFQARFVATELAWLAVCFTLFVAALLGPLVWEINSGRISPYDLTWATEFFELHNRIWLPLIALFLGVSWMLVRVSHRVAGPLYRFRQVFAQITRGDLSVRVRVRDGDYLTREGEDFDAMIRAVRDRVRRAQVSAAAVSRDLAKLSASTDRVSAKRLAELAAHAADTEDILGGFVTQADKADKRAAAEARVPKSARAGLSVTQILLIVFIALYWIAALAGPAYTAALDRARAMRTIGHQPIAIEGTRPPK